MAELKSNREFMFPLTAELSKRANENGHEDSSEMVIIDIPLAYDKQVPSEQRRLVVTDMNSRYASLVKARSGDMITVEKVVKGGTYKTWSPSDSKWVTNVHDQVEPRYLFKGIISKIGQESWFVDQFSGTLDSLFKGFTPSVATAAEQEEEVVEIAKKTTKARAKKAVKA